VPDAATSAKPSAKARRRPEPDGGAPKAREGSKKAIILTMLRHPEGATLTQLMETTHWQPHTVRGFISGAIGKQLV
jgi:transposase